MKILKINVYGFGKWQDCQFELADGLTIFSGPNEAGKSTLRQFILSILFGFRTKRGADRFLQYIPKNGSKYGGELLVEKNQRQYLLTRVKGKNGGNLTITDLQTQEVVDNAVLSQLLGAVDETLFTEMFSFGESELAEVRQLDRDEFRRRVLKIGAVGSDQWINLQSNFEKSADKLYAPNGRVKPLNKLLKQHDALEAQTRQAAQEITVYHQYTVEAQAGDKSLSEIQEKITRERGKVNRLKHAESGWDAFQEYQTIQPKLNSKFVELSEQTIQDISHRHQQLEEDQQAVADLREKVASLKQQKPQNPRILFFNQHKNDLTAIRQKLGDVQAKLAEKDRLQESQQELEDEKNRLLPQVTFDGKIPKDFSKADLAPVQAALTKKQSLDKERQDIQAQIVTLQKQLLNATPASQATAKSTHFKMSLLIISLIVALLPWVLSWQLGLKLGLTVVGILGIVLSRALAVKPVHKTNSGVLNQQEELSRLNQQLNDIQQNSETVNQTIVEFGETHELLSIEPQTWVTLQANLERLAGLDQKAVQNKTQLQQLDAGWQTFAAQTAILTSWVNLTGEPEAQLQNLRDYFDSIQQDQQEESKLKQNLDYYQEKLAAATARQSKDKVAEEKQLTALSLKDWAAFEAKLAAQNQQVSLRAKQAQLQQLLGQETLATLKHYSDHTELKAQLTQAVAELENLRQNQEQLVEQKTILTTKMQQLASDQTYAKQQQDLANLETEILNSAKSWLTQKLAAQWIDETLLVASQGRLPKIMTIAEQYFSLLTDKRYNKVSFDDQTILVFDDKHQSYEVGELSQGTAEQLYVAIRLAFVKVMADLADLPIIIDDGFVNFDAQRKQNVMTLLAQIGQNYQIIYFTAEQGNFKLGDAVKVIELAN
ncbi:AAA family ATPase [Pediococcus siamensis]|uniref:ATP-binding protein n=1 Tax=Pediococcus siamensis TaxID=381829 RepID=UPI0039A11389